MEKALLLYTISDDELRKEFVKELVYKGWIEHKDQSTLTLPQNNRLVFNPTLFQKWFENWSQGRPWDKNDFVQVNFPEILQSGTNKIPVIDSILFTIQ